MGLLSSSSKTSSSSTSTVDNHQVGADNGGLAIGAGATANVNLETHTTTTDYGALAAANATATAAVGAVAAGQRDALDFAERSQKLSVEAGAQAQRDALDFVGTEAAGNRSMLERQNADYYGYLNGASARESEVNQANMQQANDIAQDAYGVAGDILKNQSSDLGGALAAATAALSASIKLTETSQSSTNDLIRSTNEMFVSKLSDNAGVAPQTILQEVSASNRNIIIAAVIAAAALGGAYFYFNRRKAA